MGRLRIHQHGGHYDGAQGSLSGMDHPSRVGGGSQCQGGAKVCFVLSVSLANAIFCSVKPTLCSYMLVSEALWTVTYQVVALKVCDYFPFN